MNQPSVAATPWWDVPLGIWTRLARCPLGLPAVSYCVTQYGRLDVDLQRPMPWIASVEYSPRTLQSRWQPHQERQIFEVSLTWIVRMVCIVSFGERTSFQGWASNRTGLLASGTFCEAPSCGRGICQSGGGPCNSGTSILHAMARQHSAVSPSAAKKAGWGFLWHQNRPSPSKIP